MSVLEGSGNEAVYEKKFPNEPALLVKTALTFQKKGEVHAAYEAGCLGYGIQRAFEKAGIDCAILPANKVAGQRGDKIKTDKRDARLIAKMIRRKEIRPIAVPTEEDEATRDLLRCREDVCENLKRAKQQLLKFLIRHGHKYGEGTNNWTLKHWKWMDGIVFGHECEKEVYEEYRSAIKGFEERLKRLTKRLEEIAETERYKEPVKKLRAFKGIDYIIALAFVCEIGDFHRFPNAKSFMSYLGFVPSENSSGDKTRRGRITKAGNSHLRRLLIEGAWHYTWNARVGKRLEERRKGCPRWLVDTSDRALRRLHRKFHRLVLKGKHKNVAVTAVARELAGFIWGVSTADQKAA